MNKISSLNINIQLNKSSSIKEPLLLLTLLKVKGIGNKRIVDWVLNCGLDFNKCLNSLSSLLSDKQLLEFANNIEDVIEEIKYNQSLGISIVTIFGKSFPDSLYTSINKCTYLYYKGDIKLLNRPSVAVIGSTKPQTKMILPGKNITKELCSKYVIVSGLAVGCDTIAHQTCLENKGKTIAILPSPIHDILPKINNNLASQIIKHGGLLLSEYGYSLKPNDKALPKRYIDRDRIQSFLSDFVVVIDADDQSGTKYAVKQSIHDHKPVYQLNGSKMSIIKNKINCLKDIKKFSKTL